jgi:large subunit ribosomal protein L25
MNIIIKAEKRDLTGKNAARRIRRSGKLPAVLYGNEVDTIPLVLNKKDVFAILKSESGENTIFKISYDDDEHDVMIKDFQQQITTDEIIHVDLIRIAMDKVIRVTVPVELVGVSVGVKSEGGFVDFVTREVDVECLPQKIPEHLEVDISGLHLNQNLRVEDLTLPEGVEILTEPETVVVHIEAPTEAEEEKVEEAEEIMAEEEEPEVIGREKEEPESEEG